MASTQIENGWLTGVVDLQRAHRLASVRELILDAELQQPRSVGHLREVRHHCLPGEHWNGFAGHGVAGPRDARGVRYARVI